MECPPEPKAEFDTRRYLNPQVCNPLTWINLRWAGRKATKSRKLIPSIEGNHTDNNMKLKRTGRKKKQP